MLGIKHMSGGSASAGDIADYLESRVRKIESEASNAGGYYENRSAPSFWVGAGADALGLRGAVQRDDLIEVLQGRLPTGDDLSRRGNRQAERRMASDLTWSVPKSFSMLACAGSDHRLREIAREAARAVARVLEDEAITARVGHGGARVEHTGKMVAAVYEHEDARQVEGLADMDLHFHILVANVTQRSDGTWCARDLDFGARNVTRVLADFVGKAVLAKRLREIGYGVRVTQDGFEIDGISDHDISLFSRRKEQVDAALEARGLTREGSSAAQRDAVNLATRGDKSTLPESEQRWEWQQRLRDAGIDLESIITQARARGYAVTDDIAAEAVKSGVRHIGERAAVLDRNEIRLEALRAGMGRVELHTVDAAIAERAGGLLDVGDGRFTTKDALHREQEILSRARAGAGKAAALMMPEAASLYIEQSESAQGYRYSEGQRQALTLGLTSTDSVVGIVGAAGAGKTTAMKGLVEAAHGQGFEVVGVAPSAKARNELESAGAADNRTVASFLAREHDRNLQRLVILDEAGMVSAKDMDALLRKLDREGGRLVLVGDPRQLKAVEAGQPFAQLIETGAISHATIDEIKRQVDPALREIAQSFARGDASGATSKARDYMTAAPIHAADPKKPTTAERRAAIARETAGSYLSLSTEDRTRTLVLSGTNAVRQEVNAQIRAGLQARGEVARDGCVVTALDKAGLTREAAARAESYEPGMVVRLEVSTRSTDGKTHRAVSDYTVDRIKSERVILRDADGQEKAWNPAREKAAGVYAPRQMALSSGDEIIFRENQGKGGDKIVNGQTATVEHVGKGGIEARLDDGRQVHLDPEQGHAIDYGWCRTVHAAQGATVDNVIVAGESSRVATAETAYVACSRERESLRIVTDDPQRLQQSWETWAEKQHALTAARETSTPDLSRLQSLRAAAARELGRAGDLSAARTGEPVADADLKRELSDRSR